MNILVFTSIYPISGTRSEFTPIVKYFCEDWVKQGHNVIVISSTSKFSNLLYAIPKKYKRIFESKKGFVFPNKFSRKKLNRVENGVNVFQLPIFKLIPGEIPNDKILKENFKSILQFLKKENFVPDIAIGHWLSPQIQYLSLTKNQYNCKAALTLHSAISDKELKIFKKYVNDIDAIGFRSKFIQEDTNSKLDISKKHQYICLSGVKDYFGLSNDKFIPKKRSRSILKICYVGTLIQRKYPEAIIHALNLLNDKSLNFEVNYIGTGNVKNSIEVLSRNNNIDIVFHGRKSRIDVYNIINESDLMIMISENEAFGLVYLEAMLNRTIPIASKNEGIDGVIKNEFNGFLCNAGDAIELSEIIKKIIALEDETYYKIQYNAFETAKNMTDKKMASEYLKKLSNENKK